MKSKIKIKKSHRGLFTKKAEDHNMSVQAFAAYVLAHKDSYDAKTVEQANFAHNAVGFKHQTGGLAKPYLPRDTYAQNAQQDAQYAQEYQQPQQPAPADPLNPMDWLHTTQQGQVVADQYKAQGYKATANNGSNKILFTKGTGVYDDSPYVKDFNLAASAVTGVANFFQNQKLKNQERQQALQNNQPAYYENMEGQGLNNLPMYTQYGGAPEERGLAHKAFYGSRGSIYAAGGKAYPVLRPYGGGPLTAEGAKEILRDGTINGKKLTAKQKRYFGFIAGGGKPKAQAGAGDESDTPEPHTIIEAFAKLQGVDAQSLIDKYDVLSPDKQQQAIDAMTTTLQQAQQDAGTGEADQQTDAPQQQPLMKYGGKLKLKKQTGGPAAPAPQGAVSPQDQYYRDSATLLYYKNQLNDKLKAKNPTAYQNYFKGMTDVVKSNPTNPYGPAREQYIQGSDYNDYLTPDEVQKSLGAEDYQRYLNSVKGVNSYNVAQGKQPLYGTEEGNQDITKLNYGRRFASLSLTPTVTAGQTNQGTGQVKNYKREYQYNPATQNVDYTESGDTSVIPSYLKPRPVLQQPVAADATVSTKQTGGAVPTTQGLPNGSDQDANVNAEQGEVFQDNEGNIQKVADNAGTHEQGGVMLPNVKRVLENTSSLRKKDKASQVLALEPDEVQQMFGFRPKKKVSHADAYELAKEHYGKQRLKIQKNQDLINTRPTLDPLSAKSAELNYKTTANLPTDDEMFDMLFGHQEFVKDMHGIQDDGKMAKFGCDDCDHEMKAGGNWIGGAIKHPGRCANPGSPECPEGSPQYNLAMRFKHGDLHKQTGGTADSTQPDLGLYKGPKVKSGRNLYTPTGQTSEAKISDKEIVDRYKAVGVDFGNKRGKDLQSAVYNYLIDNQPDVLRETLKTYGPNIQSEKLGLQGEKAFTDPANATPEDLRRVLPGLTDSLVGARIPLPSVSTQTSTEYPTTAPQTPPAGGPAAPRLTPNGPITPKFIKQPANGFHEPTYWDELAPGVLSLADSFNRDPELYNRQEFNQLRYKQLDPTATLNANQADFEAAAASLGNNAVGSGVAAANLSNLAAQKYKANAQTLGAYDNQNAGIKNNEITYNTQVRDKQSAADASSRGQYYRNVQIARDNQRIQRLTAIQDLGRVIQMKRRQNASGNLVMKLSPAYDQQGNYNGYQYQPVLPNNVGPTGTGAARPALKPRTTTKTTTSYKLGDRTIKTETKQ